MLNSRFTFCSWSRFFAHGELFGPLPPLAPTGRWLPSLQLQHRPFPRARSLSMPFSHTSQPVSASWPSRLTRWPSLRALNTDSRTSSDKHPPFSSPVPSNNCLCSHLLSSICLSGLPSHLPPCYYPGLTAAETKRIFLSIPEPFIMSFQTHCGHGIFPNIKMQS